MKLRGQVREGYTSARWWAKRVGEELALLPDTLHQLRDGVVNFNALGKRLAEATEGLERLTDAYPLAAVRRLSEAAEAIQHQFARSAPVRATAGLESALKELGGALADLNPLWPRSNEPK